MFNLQQLQAEEVSQINVVQTYPTQYQVQVQQSPSPQQQQQQQMQNQQQQMQVHYSPNVQSPNVKITHSTYNPSIGQSSGLDNNQNRN